MSEGINGNRESVLQRPMISEELRSFCRSDLLSEEGLLKVIDRLGLTPNNHTLISNYRFFNRACKNKRVTEGIIRCLLEYFPRAPSTVDGQGRSPLHFACKNKNVTLGIMQLLLDAAPDSVRSATNEGHMPLHYLCGKKNLDEKAALEILKLLIETFPEAASHADEGGRLPIHHASMWKSPEFCRVLIEAYPGSAQISDANDELPLHLACAKWAFPTAKYLYNLFPAAINHADTDGHYPIHAAILGRSTNHEDTAMAAVEIVEFLLNFDDNVVLQRCDGQSLLYVACDTAYQNIEAGIQIIGAIYDAHPLAIEDERIMSNIHRFRRQVQAFLNSELVYARQAKDHRLMTTPDANGQLPLHKAIRNNLRLGSIRLFVNGNPHALLYPDNRGSLPLHVACEHQSEHHLRIAGYLVGYCQSTLEAVDGEGNTALHLLCRCARHDIIAAFLQALGAVSVSTRNAAGKLPIDLLWESTEAEDRESKEYIECMYRLLRANPERIMGIDMHTTQPSASTSSTPPCQSGKKRKFGP